MADKRDFLHYEIILFFQRKGTKRLTTGQGGPSLLQDGQIYGQIAQNKSQKYFLAGKH
jgi:hypothetical protein